MSSLERYDRNIITSNFGEAGQAALFQSKVLVAGAGGLGSTVIANLASLGVGSIGLIDNDRLELSNLNRQYIHKYANLAKFKVDSAKEWINEFNPEVNVKTYQMRLDDFNYLDVVFDYDLIIDCFDSYQSKFLLNKIAIESKKTLIHGGVTEYFGQVKVIIPNETACLNCIIPDYGSIQYTVKGVLSPAVSTIASIQSMEAVKILTGNRSSLSDELLTYNGLKQDFKKMKIAKNPLCPLCGTAYKLKTKNSIEN